MLAMLALQGKRLTSC